MKKLKIKIFSTVFLILTSFTLLILITATTRNYLEKENSIEGLLASFTTKSIINRESRNKLPNNNLPNQSERRIYLDVTIYTIILDDDGNYSETINHTNNDEFDESNIKSIAEKIINNHKENFHLGSLYFDRYAYVFTPDNTLIIMDNLSTNEELVRQLIVNILILIICEIIIVFITYIITTWIIKPVEKSFEQQKVFVADASHELKTPLSVMIASADAYFNDKDDKWVHNMKSESERMTKLVTELLDLAKTEKEQEKQENDLSNIIESSILTFEGLFYDNKIKLKYNIEPNIKLNCNEDLIIELMSILIDNAIKHCSGKNKVNVNLSRNNKQILLSVKNTGEPIPKEDEEKIFERFYKLDSSRNRNSNNYGLGLAIAKNIVEQHNGKISAHSESGYTEFKIIWNQK